MTTFIKKLFSKFSKIKLLIEIPNIKKFSTTVTDAKEGSDSKKDLNPEIKEIIRRLKKGDIIENHELNKIIQFYFNTKEILPGYYKLNRSLIDGMVFDIVGVQVEANQDDDIENVHLAMKEITYNIDFVIRISVKDFYELFSNINLNKSFRELLTR